jgi:hypothetical protein
MGWLKKLGNWAFGDNEDRKNAGKDMKNSMKALDNMTSDLMDIDTSNPYENAQNAFAGLDNKMADLDNVYEGAENVYAGKMKNAFEGQKNAFEDMENAFEDLTVNTQQAEFEAQQNQQNQANIMAQMSGSAGGSGIAALAQSMANQGSLQAQKASASIGAQEAENQKKAAEAEQDITLKTAGEQSRLDSQKRSADMDIQNKILGADEALQATKLGEASKLQMAEAQNATNLQMAEAQGDMDVQKLKGEGDMWSSEQEIGKQKTQMEMQMSKITAQGAEANAPKDKGFFGNLFSDERLKENIIKIKYSNSGIPIYHFNYKGKAKTWSGTMAQDLLKLGRKDAVGTRNGYYTVNYNLIDIDMKEIKPSPLKQLSPQGQQQQQQNEGMMSAGMDILSEAARRKNWEEIQQEALAIEPEAMQTRKAKDQILRNNQKELLGDNAVIHAPGIQGIGNSDKYKDSLYKKLKQLQEELYQAVQNEDMEAQEESKSTLAGLKTDMTRFREETQTFFENHFAPDSFLSKSGSPQQLSYATQIYCKNPDLSIMHAEAGDVARGQLDVYGDPIVEDACYAIVEDFNGEHGFINVISGNKNAWWVNANRAIEYIGFIKTYTDKAAQARESKAVVKIDLGGINYKIDLFFGSNDGTATKQQDRLVLQFCWDEHLLKDGSSFRRHLYEHPNIKNLNYGGFDFESMEFQPDLGPGDKNYWHDNLDGMDKLKLVDAICNVDNPFFDIKLLRTLVKEYYTYRIENAWWKAMGYEEGRLEIMRLKQNELKKQRFKMAKNKAEESGMKHFTFDGTVYPTGLTDAKIKKMEKEKEEILKKDAKVAVNAAQQPTNTGLGKDLLNKENPIK